MTLKKRRKKIVLKIFLYIKYNKEFSTRRKKKRIEKTITKMNIKNIKKSFKIEGVGCKEEDILHSRLKEMINSPC